MEKIRLKREKKMQLWFSMTEKRIEKLIKRRSDLQQERKEYEVELSNKDNHRDELITQKQKER